jgi:predicted metal-binding membrane protein
MSIASAIESAVKRDRIVVVGALSIVVVISWGYVLAGAGMNMSAFEMTRMSSGHKGMDMMMPAVWDVGYAGLMFVMWWVMMIAMMTPSAAPMLLLFAAAKRRRGESEALPLQLSAFLGGYLTVWGAFSVAAVGAQWQLDAFRALSPELSVANGLLAAILLLAVGLYQLTPIKRICLSQCRSPAVLLARYRRPGAVGAFAMGIQHGRFCLGCCWVLMLLLFVGGIMNVWWIAALAVYVGLEKLAPAGGRLSLITGAVLVGSGILVALGELY